MMKSQVEKSVFSEATSRSQILADQITRRLLEQDAVARDNAVAIEAIHKAGTGSRAEIVSLLREAETRSPNLYAVWMEEIPGGFDGQKAFSAPGTNSHGILNPYYVRKSDGTIGFNAVEEHYSQSWFTLPMARGTGILTEPYIDEGSGVEMVSFSYPVKFDGKPIGVTGIDTPLDWIVTLLGGSDVFGSRSIALLSEDMVWISHPDKARLLQPYREAGRAELSQAIASRKARILRGFHDGRQERILLPFQIPGFSNVWTLVVDIPRAALETPVRDNVVALLISGAVLMILSVLVVYFISRKLIRTPFRNLLAGVAALRNGEYGNSIAGTERGDEIGMVAQGLEGFRTALLKGREAEARAMEAREQHDRLRQKTRQEEEAKIRNTDDVIRTMGEGLDNLARGDLSCQIRTTLPSEFEPLRRNFNQSVRQLADALSTIAGAGRVISTGTTQVATEAETLAERTEQQAASLEQTAAAVNEITESVGASVRQISDAQKIGVQARGSAGASSDIMQQTQTAMLRIDENSKQIVAIVETIDVIAFQTNILALNAAVEAARAGEAGKGFAVVASEVRALSQRCAQAAKEIGTLVRTTTSDIRTGAKRVTETGKALGDISQFIGQISDNLTQILTAAQEQSATLTEINITVNAMDQVTQRNAAIAEKSRAASHRLADETDKLTQLVSRFRLPGSTDLAEYRGKNRA
ncbi:methyl-accepting chemotaxis protein [Gluconacetobacter sacchari DSM 12717]|nr:methyl-accepting chemotaxis protein [Gluconacetobacter sacchari DSM 12717]